MAAMARQWRMYATAAGTKPVRKFIDDLSDENAAVVIDEMRAVARTIARASHLRGDIYEVRAFGASEGFRILFAKEGRMGHVLLGLTAFSKKTQKAPKTEIDLAEKRLRDWRSRGAG